MTRSQWLVGAAFLVGALIGCLAGRTLPASNCSVVGQSCDNDSDCCSYGCVNHLCVCNPDRDGGVCATNNDCCSPATCSNNACSGPSCGVNGEACILTSTCCVGSLCDAGSCVSCNAVQSLCVAPSDCCSGTCNGISRGCGCGDVSQECRNNSECCSGNCIFDGGLGNLMGGCACSPLGGACNNDDSCCNPGMAQCQLTPGQTLDAGWDGGLAPDGGGIGFCCASSGVSCTSTTPCCSGVCSSGMCQ